MTVQADGRNHYFGGAELYADLDAKKIAGALSGAVQFPTVADPDQSKINREPFFGLHAYLEKTFPLVHKTMTKTVVNEMSLLYFWKGSDESLTPALFMAHQDVVPVMPGTEQDWVQPPYSGNIADDFIWGRGSSDCKSMLIGELSAAEYLIEKGYTPKRSLYFAFGHDEEVMGVHGAGELAKYLEAQGVKLEFVLDEGGGFMMGDDFGAPGRLIAKVDLLEKGYIDISVACRSVGGHSSRPGSGTALGKVARALVALEANQFKPQMNTVAAAMCKALAPLATDEKLATIMGDPDKYEAELMEHLLNDPKMAPLLYTTTAATMISASPAPNVLPQMVEAIVNFRIAPQETCQDVLNHCIEVINDPDIDVTIAKGRDPSRISKPESATMEILKETTAVFFPEATVIPGLIMGGTDACYYEKICDCCYRFGPNLDALVLSGTVHGTNERVSIHSMIQLVKTFLHIMKLTSF